MNTFTDHQLKGAFSAGYKKGHDDAMDILKKEGWHKPTTTKKLLKGMQVKFCGAMGDPGGIGKIKTIDTDRVIEIETYDGKDLIFRTVDEFLVRDIYA